MGHSPNEPWNTRDLCEYPALIHFLASEVDELGIREVADLVSVNTDGIEGAALKASCDFKAWRRSSAKN
jgi:hypothetical protein